MPTNRTSEEAKAHSVAHDPGDSELTRSSSARQEALSRAGEIVVSRIASDPQEQESRIKAAARSWLKEVRHQMQLFDARVGPSSGYPLLEEAEKFLASLAAHGQLGRQGRLFAELEENIFKLGQQIGHPGALQNSRLLSDMLSTLKGLAGTPSPGTASVAAE